MKDECKISSGVMAMMAWCRDNFTIKITDQKIFLPSVKFLMQLSVLSQLLPHIQTIRLHFFGHVARMSDTQDTFRAMHTSIRGRPKDWKCRPGRPRHTWLRTLNSDPVSYTHLTLPTILRV